MDAASLKEYCMRKKGVTTDYPFDPEVQVFRVMGKIFALFPGDGPSVNLKCDPTFAEVLRQTYAEVTPGYHMNKRHWNTIKLDGNIPDDEIFEMVDHSYEQVVKGLTKKQREGLR